MKKEIIVAADDLESRVAIIEDGELAELHVERDPRLVGSIFKAKVVSVLPGMDAAFADVGLEKNVFLCADDVGYVTETGVTSSNVPSSAPISQRLKSGQEVVVQIIRAPVAAKGARASTRLALPGRYLVLLLSDDRQIGISRKIEERKERDRLRKVGEEIRPKGCSLIIRTEAEGKNKQELSGDLRVLTDLRDRLMQKAANTRGPALLHQDLTLTYQVIRDAFNEEVDTLVIDAKGVYDNAVELIDAIAPHLRKRVKRYRGKLPIFYKYGIEGEIDRLLRRRVWLHAGGYISIDQAEAFTAIDVNTGRFTGTTGLADTILRTNLEAAEEIGRQLRLRDLGGIIVIDFIDMDRPRHRQKVMKAFGDALKRDRQKTNIVHLSPLGLIEMTRKRRGESLMGIITEACPVCAGLGRVRTPLTIALKIEREVRRIAAEGKPGAIMVRAARRVAEVMVGESGLRSVLLDKTTGCPVYVRADENQDIEEFDILPTTIANALREIAVPAKGDEVPVAALDPAEPNGDARGGWFGGYRVLLEGLPASLEPPFPVVLTQAGHSFGIGYAKGHEPKPAAPEEGGARGRRRGGRGRKRAEAAPEPVEVTPVAEVEEEVAPEVAPSEGAPRRGRGRRGRGGRGRRPETAASAEPVVEPEVHAPVEVEPLPPAEGVEAAPKRPSRRRPRGRRKPEAPAAPPVVEERPAEPEPAMAPEPVAADGAEPRKPSRRRRPRSRRKPEAAPTAVAPEPVVEVAPPPPAPRPEERGPEAAGVSSEKRRRRRGGRGRGRSEGRREGPEAGGQRPESAEPREVRREQPRPVRAEAPPPAPRPEPRVEPRPAPVAAPPAPSEEAPRRTGLLRRGSRQLGRRK